MTPYDYDLIVIGSGPGGQKAAIAAAKLGKRVAIIDKQAAWSAASASTPARSRRRRCAKPSCYLTGMNQRELYGASYRVKQNITIDDLLARTQHVIGRRSRSCARS